MKLHHFIPALRGAIIELKIDFTCRTTDEDGRCSGLAAREELGPGTYKLRFETGSYWESRGQTSLHPYVEVS